MRYDDVLLINGREISISAPTYFIADVASNHDGDLSRAKELIGCAKEAGADAVKFQHFKAKTIVSDYGFKNLGQKLSHQASWQKSVYEIYEQYECNRNWNEELARTAADVGIDFMTTPYDLEAINMLDQYIPAYKIGSGDITWTSFIEIVAKIGKPVILSTGASNLEDVERAVEAIIQHNQQIALLQCNTNYTGRVENFDNINLRVLTSYSLKYPNMVLGLSDHTPGHAAVLGAIALGARIIEKHLTDDNSRIGPDHSFSMNPSTWSEMMERSRELEKALGDGVKRVESNERDAKIVQRRCLRLTRDVQEGETLLEDDLESLRPAPEESLPPYVSKYVVGRQVIKRKAAGDALFLSDI
ncbi:N-acetylneuraminate synthase [Desulfosporosinus fructosivorans]|uniref:N-acetylneuraminate synthase n=1 Tax=Desulfosporosinus fructosivorans TaxID=2018669 RepID=A0A4Z0QZ91_9FIRM|nr:N-acetylneuraminate synthase family protein [Desulfosporosinus fructosivorans]TGE35395.1 N-acetylneuraminate synthase [Desulfosporosinus fructosivorans]